MKTATFTSSSLLLLLLVCGNGCTAMLWGAGKEPDHWPAENANLQLFDSRKRQDVLVIYTEASRRSEVSRTPVQSIRLEIPLAPKPTSHRS